MPLARPGAKQTHAVRFYPIFCVEQINPRAVTAVSGAENPSLLEMLALLMVYLPSLNSKRTLPFPLQLLSAALLWNGGGHAVGEAARGI